MSRMNILKQTHIYFAYVGACVARSVCGGQRITFRSQFSFSTMAVLRVKLKSSSLVVVPFTN